jgi:hypothetical protein
VFVKAILPLFVEYDKHSPLEVGISNYNYSVPYVMYGYIIASRVEAIFLAQKYDLVDALKRDYPHVRLLNRTYKLRTPTRHTLHTQSLLDCDL